jgi:hypothetical protein
MGPASKARAAERQRLRAAAQDVQPCGAFRQRRRRAATRRTPTHGRGASVCSQPPNQANQAAGGEFVNGLARMALAVKKGRDRPAR